MRLTTTTEDTGLSESTYELISGTDSESQDGNYTESMSESVGSLDLQRPDDVHSLAGTEHTNDDDDDESIIDESEAQVSATPDSRDDFYDETNLEHTEVLQQNERIRDQETESQSDDEAQSRSSLDYTQQSLKIPSISTPEASKIVERPADSDASTDGRRQEDGSLRARWSKTVASIWNYEGRFKDCAVEMVANALPGLIFAVMLALLVPIFYSPPPKNAAHLPAAVDPIVTTATPHFPPATSSLSSTQRALSTSTGGASLMPLEDVLSKDWLFTGAKPDLSVSKQDGNFLIHIPADVLEKWLAKGCLDFAARRNDKVVRMAVSSVKQGMLIKFPKEESFGTVTVDIAANCRPKIQKVLQITFGRSVVGEVIDRTKHFANDLTGLVPAAAQEAERCFEDAKRCLGSASDDIMFRVLQAVEARIPQFHKTLESLKTGVRDRMQSTTQEMAKNVETLTRHVQERLPTMEDVQNQAQISLLDAQISAKIWWLKVTGQDDEHDRYRSKARDFMRAVLNEANLAKLTRKYREPSRPKPPFWTRVFGSQHCENGLGWGRKGTHQCKRRA